MPIPDEDVKKPQPPTGQPEVSPFDEGLREWENLDWTMVPVRTRGAVRTRGLAPGPAAPRVPVRTRGAVRAGRPAPETGPLSPPDLIDGLREEVKGLPLVTVLYGWPEADTKRFYELLAEFLDPPDDVIWLVGSADLEAAPENAVYLNVAKEEDRKFLSKLISDMVYLPGNAHDLVAHLESWQRRSRVLLLGSSKLQVPELVRAKAGQFATRVLRWDAGQPNEFAVL